jgi:hypothetical protein
LAVTVTLKAEPAVDEEGAETVKLVTCDEVTVTELLAELAPVHEL